MSGVLLLLLLVAEVVPSQWDYVVNDFFDNSLAEMEGSLSELSAGYVELGSVVVGGYTLEGAKLGDLTSLKRHGNVTISSQGDVVTVSGYVELPNIVVKGGNITSLSSTIINPVITSNGFDGFQFHFWSRITSRTCKNGYPLERKYWTRGTVLLTSDSEQYNNIDISKFVQLYEYEISAPLEEALSEAFSNYFDFCNSILRLQTS